MNEITSAASTRPTRRRFPTLAEAIEHYLESSTPSAWKKQGASTVKRSALGGIRLSALSSKAIQSWCDKRLHHVCVATVSNQLRLIRLAYEAARRGGPLDLPPNPALKVELVDRNRRLSDDELSRVCAELEDSPVIRALVIVATETGLTRGALTAAQWRDAELDRATLHLRSYRDGQVVHSVPLTAVAVEALRSLSRSGHRVFSVPTPSIRWAWERACRRAGIKGIRFYEARHVLPFEGRSVLDASCRSK